MQVSKNIHLGGQIANINDLIVLTAAKRSVVVMQGNSYIVKPAAFIMNWRLRDILKSRLFYAIRNEDIAEVEFEEVVA